MTLIKSCFVNSGGHSLIIDNSYNTYSIGYNGFHQLGKRSKLEGINILGSDTKNFPLKKIKDLSNICMIACGNSFSICLDNNGNVFTFGNNRCGSLGINKTVNECQQTKIPQKINNLPHIKQVSCVNNFTICLSNDGVLYSFGNNNYGQLGTGSNISKIYPHQIHELIDVEYIVCGGNHSICKTYNNEFYSWGYNEYGQLGQGNNDNCNKPIQCVNWPDNIIDIKCGFNYSLLLTSEGHLYSFGTNYNGQIGINDINIKSLNIPRLLKDIPEIQRIECVYNHSMCIDIDKHLWVFGANYYGQLGLEDTENRFKPVIHSTLSNILDISSGGNITFVKTTENKIYGFGNNKYAQLGIETSKEVQVTPIQVFEGNEDTWCSMISKSAKKSARK